MSKKFLAPIWALVLSLVFAAAAHGAPAPVTTDPAAVVSAVDKLMMTRQAQAEADIETLKAKATKSGEAVDIRKVREIASEEAKIRSDIAKAGYDKALEEAKADKAKVSKLLKIVGQIPGIKKEVRRQMADFAQQLGEVDAKVDGLEKRTSYVEVRQNETADKVESISTRVSVLEAASWTHKFQFGAETGRGIATSETSAVLGYSVTSGSGFGGYSEVAIGTGELFSQPHFTSAVFRVGMKSAIGMPDSPLSAHLGFLFGIAAKSSLALDSGFSGGVSAGLVYKSKTMPVGFTANVGNVWGRFEGLVMSAGAFFDLTGLSTLGK